MNYIKNTILGLIIVSTSTVTLAQNNYEKSMQAVLRGDYKTAVEQLEKAEEKDPNNANVLKMLGYSYFQNKNYENSITTYSKLIAIKSTDVSAFYYRGKARLNIANDPKESKNPLRDSFYQASIKDFTKALEISGEEDVQLLQNRGIAYKDYGIYKSYNAKKSVDKSYCVSQFNSSIADFQKLLTIQPLRRDIIDLTNYVKAQITTLK